MHGINSHPSICQGVSWLLINAKHAMFPFFVTDVPVQNFWKEGMINQNTNVRLPMKEQNYSPAPPNMEARNKRVSIKA